MTSAQIRYWELRESQRHNIEQESYWGGSLAENVRHNQAQEFLSRYATDTQRDTALTTARIAADATKYSADTHAQASRDVASINAATSRYATDVNAETQQETSLRQTTTSLANAATQAETAKYSTDVNASTSRYAVDTQAATSRYATDVNAANFQDRLEFDRQTQNVKNIMAANELALKRNLTNAQVANLAQQTAASVEQLKLSAQRLGMEKQAQFYENALVRARTAEARASTGRQTVQAAEGLSKIVMDILDYIQGGNENG